MPCRYRIADLFDRPNQSPTILTIVTLLILITGAILIPAPPLHAQSGCCTVRGNVDCDPGGGVDIADLSRLIDYMLISFDPLCCPDAGNVDGSIDGIIDISDLSRLIDFMLISFEPLEPCGPSELPFEQRQAVFNGIDSVYSELDGLSLDTVAARLVAYLRTLTAIDSAEVIDSVSVSAWFTDGRIISIPNNLFPDTGTAVGPGEPATIIETSLPPGFVLPERRYPHILDPTKLELTQRAGAAAFNYELPTSIQAYVAATFGYPCFRTGAPIVKPLLENNGYVLEPTFTGSVSSLFNVQNAGVFYIAGHGGMCNGKDSTEHLAMWTATYFAYNLDTAYRTLLNRNELVYMYARDMDPFGQCTVHWRFAFTGRFVAQYMTFAPHSLAYVTGCQTDSVPSLGNGFKTAGASVYCGWTRTTRYPYTVIAAEFLFDRMLGANASTFMSKESPPQRPFDVDRLYIDMKNRKFDYNSVDKGNLRVRRLKDNFGLLAPSIRSMAIVEGFDTLYITGMFGTDPGASKRRVIVGGTDMLVYDWQPQIIFCFIPNTGAGSVGPVHVEVDGVTGPSSSIKRKSNVVNITEWHGLFTYKQDDYQSLEGKIVIDARLRADIHPFRDVPHETPKFYSTIFAGMDNSFGLASASGHAEYYHAGDPGYYQYWDWSGSHYIPGLWEQILDGFLMTGYVTQASKQFRLHIVAAENEGMNEHISYSDGSDPSDNDLAFNIPFCIYDALPGYIYITMNNQWDLVGGARSCNECCSQDPANETGIEDIIHTFSWPTIPASWAPDTTAGQ